MAEILIGNVSYKPAVGMHHIQFAGEPTPAEIWAGTSWEIDTKYQGRVPIGSGGEFAFGATGGEAKHTLTVGEMPKHTHATIPEVGVDWTAVKTISTFNISTLAQSPNLMGRDIYTSATGGSQPHNNMQPYIVVNYWKRTA